MHTCIEKQKRMQKKTDKGESASKSKQKFTSLNHGASLSSFKQYLMSAWILNLIQWEQSMICFFML